MSAVSCFPQVTSSETDVMLAVVHMRMCALGLGPAVLSPCVIAVFFSLDDGLK